MKNYTPILYGRRKQFWSEKQGLCTFFQTQNAIKKNVFLNNAGLPSRNKQITFSNIMSWTSLKLRTTCIEEDANFVFFF